MPYSLQYGDVYYSKADALGESSYVFVQGNALHERFAALEFDDDFVIGELGFGAALNFLNTCNAWCTNAPVSARLHYVACELHPFAHADLQRLLQQFPALGQYAHELLKFYPDHTHGAHQFMLRFGEHVVSLTLLYGDAIASLEDYFSRRICRVDAWFLDGFAPKVNPGMWREPLLALIARSCVPGTTMSSYSVAGIVRSALEHAGFRHSKRAGFTGKRHMLHAVYAGDAKAAHAISSRGTACIVGGGLAGCSTAYALAQQGWRVTLLEHAPTLASGGSGNLQGILHCKPATADTLDNHFNLHAYLHAERHYSALAEYRGLQWHRCGMLHVGFNAEQQKRFGRVLDTGRYTSAIMRKVDAEEASAIAGVSIDVPCLHFPRSGWLTPGLLCELYATHPGVTVHTGQQVSELIRVGGQWEVNVTSTEGARTIKADTVVLCNGADAYAFPQCRSFPIISNRGQVDVYASSAETEVTAILCGQGYVLPLSNGKQSIGGSYYVESTTPEKNQQLHIELLGRMQPGLAQGFAQQMPLQRRVGQRCQTPDRMPLVGAVDARNSPGLYISIGHGSNGLARTPLCAAYLSSLITGTPSPMEGRLTSLLEPARFTAK